MDRRRFTLIPYPGSIRLRACRERVAPVVRWSLLIVSGLFFTTGLAFAQSSVFHTRKSASAEILPLVLGGGLEFETDSNQTQYDVPFLLQYSFTETFQATIETALTHIDSNSEDVRTVTGADDIETSLEYEFLRERRYRPSLTVFGGMRWPTSTDADIGAPGRDYSIGLIAAKEFDFFEVDLNAIYTVSGDPEQQDILELPFAVQYPVNHYFDLVAEILPTLDMGGGGDSSTPTEFTLGGVLRSSPFLTLEAGAVIRDDGTWQLLFGFEYSFAGDY